MFKENVWTLREQFFTDVAWNDMYLCSEVKWREQRNGLIKLFQKKGGSGSSSLWMCLNAPWAGVHFQICNLSIIKQWAAHIDAYLPKCVTQFPKQQLHLNILSRKKRKSQTHEISAHQTEVWYKYDKRGSDKKKLEEEESWIFFFLTVQSPSLPAAAAASHRQLCTRRCRSFLLSADIWACLLWLKCITQWGSATPHGMN